MKHLKALFKVLISCHLILLQVSAALSETHARLVGAVPTKIEDAPYMVQLFRDGIFHCGGSLIEDNLVITAAHCVYKKHPLSFEVVAGVSTRLEFGIRSEVRRIRMSPAFNRKDFNMDVALLELKKPLRGESVGTIDICEHDWNEGDQVELFGWGKLEEDAVTFPIQVQTTTLTVVNKETCRENYRSKLNLTESMSCAAESGRDACLGDSGGPAVINGKLCGVVSVGSGCARKNSPGIFTNLWKIREVINKM